ncbi:MAG TPA: LysM peptidoglycan-binding domain-containing protein, partial [Acidimicrobiales bacterium]|nr:LysM peptidoglycan-binding domain-containing protein [Acidimicrobiales bacterium]
MTRQRAAAVVRFVGGLALLAGIPAALVVTVGWPLPREVPSPEQLREAFDRRGVPVEVLVKALAVIMWVAWAQLAIAVVAETVAAARGRQAGRAAVVPGVQLVARHFVASGALVLSLVGPWRPASAAAGVTRLDAIHQEISPIEVQATPNPAAAPSPAPPTPALAANREGTYVVQRGDSYWGLAQQHLGDGARWREIRDANVGRTVAPGHVIGAHDDDLQPGWVILLPATATPSSAPAAGSAQPALAPTGPQRSDPSAAGDRAQAPAPGQEATGGSGGEVTVMPGDDFWKLAERQLAERWGRPPSNDEIAPYWRQLVEINRPRLAPPGDPDLIYPGQRFLTPPVADGVAPTEPTPEPTAPLPEAPGPATAPVPTPRVPPETPPPAASGPDAPDATPPSDGRRAQPSPGPGPPTGSTESQPPTATEGGDGTLGDLVVPVGLAGGGMSLAGLVLWLDRRRRAQQRHRRQGRRIVLPPAAAQRREAELRAGADIDRARLVDAALRAAGAGCGPAALPPLRWVEAGTDSVLVVLTAPAQAPRGFRGES